MWILPPPPPAKLPNSDLDFALDVWVDFFSCFDSHERGPKKSAKFTQEFVRKDSPRISAEAFLENCSCQFVFFRVGDFAGDVLALMITVPA